MNERSALPAAILGGFIGLGIAFAGIEFKQAFIESRRSERFVTVKGLAEREVKADTAIWPISFTAVSAELAPAYEKSETDKQRILSFLTAGGIEPSEVDMGQLHVSDSQAREYGENRGGPRFIVTQTVVVHTKKVDQVSKLSGHMADLLKAGVVLATTSNVAFHFTGVNAIKPEMLAEATRNARAAAAQFAADSGTTVGQIRRANQGALSIIPLEGDAGGSEGGYPGNAEQRITQKARAVVTIDFLLGN